MYSVGTVLRDLDDPHVNALTITENANGIYTVVERVSPSSESASPMWCRYQVSHEEIAQKEREGLLERGSTLSPDEIQSVKSLASAHPEAIPEMEQNLNMI